MEVSKITELLKKNHQISISIFLVFFIAIMNIVSNEVMKLLVYTITYIALVIYLYYICERRATSILVIFTIFHFVFIGIGPLPLAIRKGLFLSKIYNLILLSFYAFCITASYIYNSKGQLQNIKKIVNKMDNEKKDNDKLLIILSYVLIGISLIAIIIYLIKNFKFLFGGNMEQGRITSLQGNGILLYTMWFGLVGLCLLLRLVLENKLNFKIFILLYLMYGTMSVLIGFRSRVITLILFTVLLYIQKRKIKFKRMFIIGIIILLLTGILGIVRGVLSNGENSNLLSSFSILFENGAFNINHVMNFFPSKIDYQYGYTFLLNIIMLKPGPNLDFTLWLKEKMNMNFAGGGVTPTLVGELYINFGYIGTILGFSLIAIILIFLDEIYKTEKSTFNVVTIIWAFLISCRGGLANTEITVLVFLIVYNGTLFVTSETVKKLVFKACNIFNKIRRE